MTETNRVARLRFELVAAEFLVRMGARIEQRRKQRGLSRADLARQLPGKVSENQLYRWERGKHQPNPDTLQAIADALDCDVAELMAPEPAKQRTPDLSVVNHRPPAEDDRIGQILEIVKELDDRLEQLMLARAQQEADEAEALRRIEAELSTMRATRRGRRQ